MFAIKCRLRVWLAVYARDGLERMFVL